MSRINPTVRAFAIILLIAVGIWLLQLQTALISLLLIARIAFFLAIAFFLFLVWRERRGEISMWPRSSQVVFYGAVGLAVANIGAAILAPYPSGASRCSSSSSCSSRAATRSGASGAASTRTAIRLSRPQRSVARLRWLARR